jgi:hypothetical protein
MPLTRGRGGKLGVQAVGGGGGVIQLEVITNLDATLRVVRNETGMQVQQLRREVPALVADHQNRKG